ncbi:hypothetical protein GXP71_16955 [Cellulomonas sp. H30R-01]|uniref:hypothetical protein n=1 Tax=Cellulomonas sp. H30R-01 TaxID=2704467 RepID=UPI00138C1146|nr:hypothetical protein [Cellulomonas sp. H30R-01]QHT57596.1 hypothetical protein GXP71_16955 [Cellulomonas sp. H30R-01]
MATFSAVTRQHILQAIGEHDSRGRDDFLGVYGFTPDDGYALLHEGRVYEPRAIVGVAHRYATGRLGIADEVAVDAATAVLRKRGFDVTEPAVATRAPVAAARPARAPRSTTRTSTPRTTTRASSAAPERVAPICPTCSMTLPATGVCDYCG